MVLMQTDVHEIAIVRHTVPYRAARDLYHRVRHRDHGRAHQARRALYRPFIVKADLVFDIGANIGGVTDAMLALGARVVAVEPNPTLAGKLRRRYGSTVQVEEVAVGARPGTAELHLGVDPGHSTLSKEWLVRAPTPGRWKETVTTTVTTLDALIAKHGVPAFIKIDVEGYDSEVLAGLSVPVQALSFEYQGAYPEATERCLARLGEGWEYAMTKGDDPFLATGWMSADRLLAAVRSSTRSMWGDVFARRIRHSS
jgi:FkbM family methyltransferase